jgi:hypothetical protein
MLTFELTKVCLTEMSLEDQKTIEGGEKSLSLIPTIKSDGTKTEFSFTVNFTIKW